MFLGCRAALQVGSRFQAHLSAAVAENMSVERRVGLNHWLMTDLVEDVVVGNYREDICPRCHVGSARYISDMSCLARVGVTHNENTPSRWTPL